jgi:glycosyltransferase involved in cell wall biosynthesis
MSVAQSGKRIAVVIVISNLEFGGAQRQVVELANHIDVKHFDLHICSLSEYVPLSALLDPSQSTLHIVKKHYKFDVSVVPRLANLLRKLKADVVHGYLFDAEIAVRLAGRMAGVAAIGNSERNTDYKFKRRQLVAHHLTRGFVDFYIANSNAGAKFSRNALRNAPEQYYTVHNGVDTQRFTTFDGTAVRESLGLGRTEFVVGMFGSFKTQKNHPLLFKAMRLVLDSYPGARLLLVGDQLAGGLHGSTDYKQRMLEQVKQLDLERHCVFAGNRSDVEKLYAACDVTALPSLFEGTPNVALESMACGVPVVATNVSDNAYVIRDGETGYLVSLGDAERFAERLLTLARDPDLRRRMGTAGREWVEQEFSCARLAEKTAAVYRDVLGRAAPDARPLKSF